jgi:hypothetical protein
MESPLVRALTVAGLTLFAALLYVLRDAKRVTYGYCEVAVGVAGLWAALSRLDADRMAVGLGIAASVYVVVRGMVNIEDGREKNREDGAEPPQAAVPSAPAAPQVREREKLPPSEPGAGGELRPATPAARRRLPGTAGGLLIVQRARRGEPPFAPRPACATPGTSTKVA